MPVSDPPENMIVRSIAVPQTGSPRHESPAPPIVLIILMGLLVPALLAYAFATADETQVFGGLIGLIALVVILRHPSWGLVFFVGLLYVRPEENIPALAGMHFSLIVALVTLAGMLFQLALDRQPFIRTPLNGMIFGFGLIAVASSFSTGTAGATVTDISRLVILVLLVVNLTRTPGNYHTLVTAILVFTGYLALYSLYLFHSGVIVLQDGYERSEATGIFSDPNDLASVFVAALALALARLAHAGKIARVLYLMLAALLLYSTFVTNSRGATLAMLVVAGGFMLGFLRRKPLVAVAALLAGLGLLMGTGRMSTFDSSEASANQRFWYWDNGINLLRDNPILGVGYNQFPGLNGGMTAHNSFVLCFAELGLLGYFFWMGCLYYCYRKRNHTEVPTETDVLTETEPKVSTGMSLSAQDLFGARLGLAAYLTASFWLSHTYSALLFLFICLPISAQIAWSGGSAQTPIPVAERWRDWGRIAVLCVGSIIFINLMEWHYR